MAKGIRKRHRLDAFALAAEMESPPHGLAKFSAENLAAVLLAVLTAHRTAIHCRSAVRKTLCVFLTTSALFALRAHNPATMRRKPILYNQNEKAPCWVPSFCLRATKRCVKLGKNDQKYTDISRTYQLFLCNIFLLKRLFSYFLVYTLFPTKEVFV